MLGSNRVIAKNVKSCTYSYNVRCTTIIVRVWGMPWPRAGPNHAWLGLLDEDRAFNGLVVCFVVWLRSMIYGMGLCLVPCCVQDSYRAQVPHNIPQILTDLHHIHYLMRDRGYPENISVAVDMNIHICTPICKMK